MIDTILARITGTGIRIQDIVDIIIIAVLIYNVIKKIKGTRAEQLSKGIILLLVLTQLSEWLQIYTVNWLLSSLIQLGMFAVLIVFQPELRRGLEFLGRTSSFKSTLTEKKDYRSSVVTEISDAIGSLSRQKIGALIVIEKKTGLNEIADTGTKVDAVISSSLLINIFIPNTPLHDGAVVIKGNRIIAAACFLPLSDSQNISKDLGTRHRAAIGMSERSDSLSIIVSEETGSISIAQNGILSRHLDIPTLESILEEVYNPKLENGTSWLRWLGGFKNNEK